MRWMARPVRMTPRAKYGAVRTTVDGHAFDSMFEGRTYAQLMLEYRAGLARAVIRQPVYPLIVNGVCVGRYIADFEVHRFDGEIQVIDCKGVKTPTYRLKKRLFEALYPHRIVEVTQTEGRRR